MSLARRIARALSAWIDSVAETILALQRWFGASRRLRFVEQNDASFTVEGGGRALARLLSGRSLAIKDGRILDDGRAAQTRLAEVAAKSSSSCRPERFMFRPLELPSRAADFLDGVVRAQIDRLTPWTAADAAYGSSAPIISAMTGCRSRSSVPARSWSRLRRGRGGRGCQWVSVSAQPQAGSARAKPIRIP